MIKRCVIFIFLATAYAVLQAHNFIPHHHEDDHTETSHHHGDEDNHADHHDDHNFPFTDFTHNADFGKTIVKPTLITGVDEKAAFVADCFIDLYNKLASFHRPTEYHPPDDDSPLHLIFLSHSVPLRAPPAC